MALTIVREDLFKVEADTKIITINTVGGFGAGIAKTARDTIPGIHKHYLKMYKKITPEQFILYRWDMINYLMVPTKIDWRDPSPRSLVVHNLNRLVCIAARTDQLGTIALPPMGCGNGGLSWDSDIQYLYRALLPFARSDFICCLGET